MEYRALYRQTRPEVFSEILGQEHIVKILKHQVETNTVSHAYLFCGTRGTGKTTTARILAKAVNCKSPEDDGSPCGCCSACTEIAEGKFMDVIEIDAASNNGVENVRELKESVKYPPVVGRKKVYIIDEVHMLSTGAANALLKTLEEPPEHVMFILATTDPQKLPQTIMSRCLRLDFRRVAANVIAANMEAICNARNVEISDAALKLLASNADGSVRDSLSLLEQCLAGGDSKIERDDVLDILGAVSEEFYIELTEAVLTKNVSKAFLLLDEAVREGKEVKQIMKDWMAHFRSLLITKYVKDVSEILNMSDDNIALLKKQAGQIELSEINNAILTLARSINDARYSSQARILLEVAMVSIASGMEYGKPIEPVSVAASGLKGISAISQINDVKQNVAAKAGLGPAAQKKVDAVKPVAIEKSETLQIDDSNMPDGVNAPYTEDELDEMWQAVSEEVYKYTPSAGAAFVNSNLAEIGESQFKVYASGFAMRVLETESGRINELMSARLGRNMRMVVKNQNAANIEDKMDKIEKIAKEASDILGIKVDIR